MSAGTTASYNRRMAALGDRLAAYFDELLGWVAGEGRKRFRWDAEGLIIPTKASLRAVEKEHPRMSDAGRYALARVETVLVKFRLAKNRRTRSTR